MTTIGVLALQGDVREHLTVLERCGAHRLEVRTPPALAHIDGLIIPGGESPTIGKLLIRCGLDVAIRERAQAGMPIYGTCAGMILLGREASGGQPPLLGLMDLAVDRNAYGRQRESFEAAISAPEVDHAPIRVAFIRAPVVTWVGNGVEVLATYAGDPVLLRQGRLLVSSFHPEITGYDGVHRYFCATVREAKGADRRETLR